MPQVPDAGESTLFTYDPDNAIPDPNAANYVKNGSGPYRPINERFKHEPSELAFDGGGIVDGSRFHIAFVSRDGSEWPGLNLKNPQKGVDVKIMLWDAHACALDTNYRQEGEIRLTRNSEYHIVHETVKDMRENFRTLNNEAFRASYTRRRHVRDALIQQAQWSNNEQGHQQLRTATQQVARVPAAGSEELQGVQRGPLQQNTGRTRWANDENNYAPHATLCHMLLWQLSADRMPISVTMEKIRSAVDTLSGVTKDHPLQRFFETKGREKGQVKESTRAYANHRLKETPSMESNLLYAQVDMTAIWGLQMSKDAHVVLWTRANANDKWRSFCLTFVDTSNPGNDGKFEYKPFDDDGAGWEIEFTGDGFPFDFLEPTKLALEQDDAAASAVAAPSAAPKRTKTKGGLVTSCIRWHHKMTESEIFDRFTSKIRIWSNDGGVTWKCKFNDTQCGVFRDPKQLRGGLVNEPNDAPWVIDWPGLEGVSGQARLRPGSDNAMLWWNDAFAEKMRRAIRVPAIENIDKGGGGVNKQMLDPMQPYVGSHALFANVQDGKAGERIRSNEIAAQQSGKDKRAETAKVARDARDAKAAEEAAERRRQKAAAEAEKAEERKRQTAERAANRAAERAAEKAEKAEKAEEAAERKRQAAEEAARLRDAQSVAAAAASAARKADKEAENARRLAGRDTERIQRADDRARAARQRADDRARAAQVLQAQKETDNALQREDNALQREENNRKRRDAAEEREAQREQTRFLANEASEQAKAALGKASAEAKKAEDEAKKAEAEAKTAEAEAKTAEASAKTAEASADNATREEAARKKVETEARVASALQAEAAAREAEAVARTAEAVARTAEAEARKAEARQGKGPSYLSGSRKRSREEEDSNEDEMPPAAPYTAPSAFDRYEDRMPAAAPDSARDPIDDTDVGDGAGLSARTTTSSGTDPPPAPDTGTTPGPGQDEEECGKDRQGRSRRKGMGTSILSVSDQGGLNFTSDEGKLLFHVVYPFEWWSVISTIAPPARAVTLGCVDPCNEGWWWRGRFFADGDETGPSPGILWSRMNDEWNNNTINREAPSRWQTAYPLWAEDRILTKLKPAQ